MLKQQISSPLEAGPSILDAAQLPPRLTPALDYASSRLARKGVHLSVVVVRREYQCPLTIDESRGASGFAAALRSLVSRRERTSSSVASTPPLTPASSITDEEPLTPGGYRYVHGNISVSAQRIQRVVLKKASRKFGLGCLLSPAVSASSCGLTMQLIRNSLAQNEALFSSDGLTLFSLDRLYGVKSALSSYCMTESPLRLEDPVDELRRCVLSNGVGTTRTELLCSYEALSVSDAAVEELDCMYRRAYGGPEQMGAIAGMPQPDDFGWLDDPPDIRPSMIGLALTTAEPSKPSTPRVPVLKLLTNFDVSSQSVWEEDDDDECTARPIDSALPGGFAPWNISSEYLLNATSIHGPMTPNGYDDISPITRGEWGILMGGSALSGRVAAVETC